MPIALTSCLRRTLGRRLLFCFIAPGPERQDHAAARYASIPHAGLVLNQDVIRKQLNILRRVLYLVPFTDGARSELPISCRPPAYFLQRAQVPNKLLARGQTDRPIALTNRVHNKAETHNARAVHQPGLPWVAAPG